jgi:hypothetical protein
MKEKLMNYKDYLLISLISGGMVLMFDKDYKNLTPQYHIHYEIQNDLPIEYQSNQSIGSFNNGTTSNFKYYIPV